MVRVAAEGIKFKYRHFINGSENRLSKSARAHAALTSFQPGLTTTVRIFGFRVGVWPSLDRTCLEIFIFFTHPV